MLKIIFELLKEPLGLPIGCLYEWIILVIIDKMAYLLAYEKVGGLYLNGFISGRSEKSVCHWIIRTVYFVIMWATAYGVIWICKLIISHKNYAIVGASALIAIALIAKVMIWISGQKRLEREVVRVDKDRN